MEISNILDISNFNNLNHGNIDRAQLFQATSIKKLLTKGRDDNSANLFEKIDRYFEKKECSNFELRNINSYLLPIYLK